jgi:hypothetical protein
MSQSIPEEAAGLAGLEPGTPKPWVPDGYRILRTNDLVADQTAYGHRFRWLAERHRRRLQSDTRVPFYRWEVHDAVKLYGACEKKGQRWLVVALQNVLAKVSACPYPGCPGHIEKGVVGAGGTRCGLGMSPCAWESL